MLMNRMENSVTESPSRLIDRGEAHEQLKALLCFSSIFLKTLLPLVVLQGHSLKIRMFLRIIHINHTKNIYFSE